MAIVSVKEIKDGRQGGSDVKSMKSFRKHTRGFRVTASSASDDDFEVSLYLPALGSLHPYDLAAWCIGKRCIQDSKSKFVWNCTVEYSTEKQLNEDPTKDPTTFEWDTDTKTVTFAYDKDGKAILNAAGEPFITGITDEVSLWTITAVKNLSEVPAGILGYKDAVNSDNIIVDGIPFPPDTLKIKKIHISKLQSRNDIWFRELQLVLKAQDTWKRKIIEQGLNQLVSSKLQPCYETSYALTAFNAAHATNDDLAKVEKWKARKPMPLNADGTQMTIPVTDPADIIWKTVDLRKTLAFRNLPLDLSAYLGS